jgi:hypothetical protein
MGGIIRGFLGGAGNAMAQFGQMQLAKNLQAERDESEFLRSKALNKENRGYQTEERLAGQKFTASESALNRASNEGIIASKAKAKKDEGQEPTSQMQNVEYLMKKGGISFEGAISATFPNAKTEFTDTEGNITAVVVTKDGFKKVYTMKQNDAGVVEVLQPGEESTITRPTKEEKRLADKTAADKAKYQNLDSTDFPVAGTEREFAKREAQRLADERNNPSANKPDKTVNKSKRVKLQKDPQAAFDQMEKSIEGFDAKKATDYIRQEFNLPDWNASDTKKTEKTKSSGVVKDTMSNPVKAKISALESELGELSTSMRRRNSIKAELDDLKGML